MKRGYEWERDFPCNTVMSISPRTMRRFASLAKDNGSAPCCWQPPQRVFDSCAVISSTAGLLPDRSFAETLVMAVVRHHLTKTSFSKHGGTIVQPPADRPSAFF